MFLEKLDQNNKEYIMMKHEENRRAVLRARSAVPAGSDELTTPLFLKVWSFSANQTSQTNNKHGVFGELYICVSSY